MVLIKVTYTYAGSYFKRLYYNYYIKGGKVYRQPQGLKVIWKNKHSFDVIDPSAFSHLLLQLRTNIKSWNEVKKRKREKKKIVSSIFIDILFHFISSKWNLVGSFRSGDQYSYIL